MCISREHAAVEIAAVEIAAVDRNSS